MYTLGVNEIFGEEDFILKKKHRTHSAICVTSNVEVTVIL